MGVGQRLEWGWVSEIRVGVGVGQRLEWGWSEVVSGVVWRCCQLCGCGQKCEVWGCRRLVIVVARGSGLK